MIPLIALLFLITTGEKNNNNNIIHPLHVTTTELNYESEQNSLEVTIKVFTDDFEQILSKKYHKKADFYKKDYYKEMSVMVSDYIHTHLKMTVLGKNVDYQYLGHEINGEAVYVYFEADKIKPFKKIEINNSLLYDLYGDQISFMHTFYDGTRQTKKLIQPQQIVDFNW